MDRNVYIGNNDPAEALAGYLKRLEELGCFAGSGPEEIGIEGALGRVSYEAVTALICDPVYNASAMDGIMVSAEKTASASELRPLTLKLSEDFEYINTGGEIKPPFDAVVMIEDVIRAGENTVRLIAPAVAWQNIRVAGESLVAGEMLLPSKKRLTPADMGALIAGGHTTVRVYRRPRAGIIPTGAELVEDPAEIGPGRLMESNSYMFAGLISEWGGEYKKYPIVRDDYPRLRAAVEQAAAECGLVILNAGTSAGTKDFAVSAIAELGEVYAHGLAVRPGKPTALGIVNGKPVLGIPGYPVSAYLMADLFVKPIIYRMLGLEPNAGAYAEARLTRRIVSSFKNEEIVRVALGEVGGKLAATPLDRGAAAVMSLSKADGSITVPRLREGIEAGETVNVKLFRPLDEIKKTLTVIGSHDLIIDYIADRMKLSSAHVGSLGGIMSLRKNECHLAPIHLLDEATGEYNISYVRNYMKGLSPVLIKGVQRIQGFIVQKGNPKNITGFESLAAAGVNFANRQRGAGTRVLLDYYLKRMGIDKNHIQGYEKEFGTHLAVAVAVKTGSFDAGLGVMSAARALDLDFIPVCSEDYDFLTVESFMGDERVKTFIEIIKSAEFKENLDRLGGYSGEKAGALIRFDDLQRVIP